jgi:hypothetical protein
MIVNGESVKTCTQNLAQWVPELRDHLLAILNAPALSEMEPEIRRSVELAEQILNGIDVNENAEVEAIAGECAALAAYQSTYQMADMPLLPVNPLETPTATSEVVTPFQTVTSAAPNMITPTKRPGESVSTQPASQPTSPPQQPTREPRPTKEEKPTKEPKPPKENNPQSENDSQPNKKK